MQVVWTIVALTYAITDWREGRVTSVHGSTSFSASEYWLQWLGLHEAVRFLSKAPFLFIPATRGSVINAFLGIQYSQAIKFHRYVLPCRYTTMTHDVENNTRWFRHSFVMHTRTLPAFLMSSSILWFGTSTNHALYWRRSPHKSIKHRDTWLITGVDSIPGRNTEKIRNVTMRVVPLCRKHPAIPDFLALIIWKPWAAQTLVLCS